MAFEVKGVPAGKLPVSKGIKDILQDLAGLEHPCVVLPRHGDDSIHVGNDLGRNVCNVCVCVCGVCVCVWCVCVYVCVCYVCVLCVCVMCVCVVLHVHVICFCNYRLQVTEKLIHAKQVTRHQHVRLSLHKQKYRHTTFLRSCVRGLYKLCPVLLYIFVCMNR